MNYSAVNSMIGKMTRASQKLAAMKASMSKLVENQDWHGTDHDRFVRDWTDQYAPAIQDAVSRLDEATVAARRAVNGQQTASAT